MQLLMTEIFLVPRAQPQHIPARQRAVLILRDVLGFSAKEAAETLEMTAAAIDTS